MANSPSKVGREGAAFKTPNGQANDRVHEPHDDTIGVEEFSNSFSQQAGHILRELRFVHIQLKVINEAGAFSSSVLSKDFERLLLDDDNWLFFRPRTITSDRTVLEHAIITKLYKTMIKKRAEKEMVEFMARKVFGLDKGKAHVDNTVSVTGIMELVLDAIQSALDAKLEEDPISRWPAPTFEIIPPLPLHPLVTKLVGASDANETPLPSHEANHDSNKKLSPSQIERVEEAKYVIRKLLALVTERAISLLSTYAIADIPEAERSKALRNHERVRAWLLERLLKGLAMDEDETWHYLEEEWVQPELPFFIASAHAWAPLVSYTAKIFPKHKP